MVLQNLDGHHFVSAFLPALDDLSESAPSQELQHFVLVAERAENLVLHKLIVTVSCGRALRSGSSCCLLLNVSVPVPLRLFVRGCHRSTYLLPTIATIQNHKIPTNPHLQICAIEIDDV